MLHDHPDTPATESLDVSDAKPRLSMVERVYLAQRVAVARAKGQKWDDIARAEGRPKRTLQALYSRYMAEDKRLGDPSTLLREHVDLHTEAIREYAELAASADNSSARIGAIRSMLQAADCRMDLYIALGLAPQCPTAAAQHEENREIVEECAALFRRHNLSKEVMDEMVALAEKVAPANQRHRPPQASA